MLKEFYDFIAKRIHSYFIEVSAEGVLQKGESFCLKLDDIGDCSSGIGCA